MTTRTFSTVDAIDLIAREIADRRLSVDDPRTFTVSTDQGDFDIVITWRGPRYLKMRMRVDLTVSIDHESDINNFSADDLGELIRNRLGVVVDSDLVVDSLDVEEEDV